MDRRTRAFLAAGLAVAMLVAVAVSQFASADPDGLEYVAEQEGFIDSAEDHAFADAPLADYGANISDDARVGTAVAGLAGVLITIVLGYGVFWIARRSGEARRRTAPR